MITAISAISGSNLGWAEAIGQLKFAGHMFTGTADFPPTKMPTGHDEVHAAFKAKARELAISDQPWIKLALTAIRRDAARAASEAAAKAQTDRPGPHSIALKHEAARRLSQDDDRPDAANEHPSTLHGDGSR